MLAVTARSQAGQRVAELFRLRQGRWQLAFSAPAGPRGVLDFDGGPRRGVIAFQSKAGDLEVLSLDEQAEPGDRHIVDVRPTTAVARLLGTDIDLAYAGERGSRKVFGLDTFRGRSSELHESPNGLDATPIGIVANDGTIRVLVDSSGAGQRRFTAGAQAQPRSSEPTLASTAVYRARQWFRTETRVGFHAIVAGADKNGPVTFIGTTLLLSPPSPRVAYELGTVTG